MTEQASCTDRVCKHKQVKIQLILSKLNRIHSSFSKLTPETRERSIVKNPEAANFHFHAFSKFIITCVKSQVCLHLTAWGFTYRSVSISYSLSTSMHRIFCVLSQLASLASDFGVPLRNPPEQKLTLFFCHNHIHTYFAVSVRPFVRA